MRRWNTEWNRITSRPVYEFYAQPLVYLLLQNQPHINRHTHTLSNTLSMLKPNGFHQTMQKKNNLFSEFFMHQSDAQTAFYFIRLNFFRFGAKLCCLLIGCLGIFPFRFPVLVAVRISAQCMNHMLEYFVVCPLPSNLGKHNFLFLNWCFRCVFRTDSTSSRYRTEKTCRKTDKRQTKG